MANNFTVPLHDHVILKTLLLDDPGGGGTPSYKLYRYVTYISYKGYGF